MRLYWLLVHLIVIVVSSNTTHRPHANNSNSLLTFKTAIVGRSYSTSEVGKKSSSNDLQQQSPLTDTTEIRISYHNNKAYFLVVLFLILLTPLGLVIWCGKGLVEFLVKKCCCSRARSWSATRNNFASLRLSESTNGLSGECGCMIKIRRDKKRPSINSNESKFFPLPQQLISKPDHSVYLLDNPKNVIATIELDEDDMTNYQEFTKSLGDIKKELVDLENM